MNRGPGERRPPTSGGDQVPWEDIWQKIVGQIRGGEKGRPGKMRRVGWILIGIVVVIGLVIDMTYIVGPAEVGVVRQFGEFVRVTDPGLNFRLPRPIEAHDIVNVREIREAEIGFRTVEHPGRPARHVRVPDEAMMLTGDRNIADVRILVFYQVVDAEKYLFRAEAPEIALRVNTEVALRSVIGQMDIDHAMTVGRPEIEVGTKEFLQSLLDDHYTGLHIVGVQLMPVGPPDEVAEAFYDVIRAKADRERLERVAEGYARDVVPRARGDAAALIHAATAFRDERIALAEGDAERFRLILEEYRMAPAVTRQRLFLEMIERVLAGTEKFIIDPAVAGGLLQFLPLVDLEPAAVIAPEGGE